MKKKILIITIIISLLGALAVAAYFLLRPAAQSQTLPGADPDSLYGTTAPTSTVSAPGVDISNAQDLLRLITAPAELYWEVTTTLYGQSDSLTRTGRFWRTETGRRVELLSGSGELIRTVVADSAGVTVTNELTGDSVTMSDGPQFTAEAVMGMADVNALLSAPPGVLRAAELRDFGGVTALYVELYYSDIRQTDQYYISLEYGLPLRVRSFHAGSLVYEADTVALSSDNR